jgi:hypothetical protein
MEFKHIRKAIIREENKDLKDTMQRAKENLKNTLQRSGKTYKGTPEQQLNKFEKYLIKKSERRTSKELERLKEIEEAPTLPNPLIITVEWRKSQTWGANPKAFTNYGFESESIGGCGYCKKSTATAYALNSCLPILKELCKKKEKILEEDPTKTNNERELFGYGLSHGIIPTFAGGVGVESHRNVIEKLGLKWNSLSYTPNTNVYQVALK